MRRLTDQQVIHRRRGLQRIREASYSALIVLNNKPSHRGTYISNRWWYLRAYKANVYDRDFMGLLPTITELNNIYGLKTIPKPPTA